MLEFIGVISFFGLIVCIIKSIINVFRKKPRKKCVIGAAICFVAFVICFALTPPVSYNQQIKNKESIEVREAILSNEEAAIMYREKESAHEEVTTNQEDNIYLQEDNDTKKGIVEEETTQSIRTVASDYDELQSLFLTLSFETTEDDLLKWLEDTNLEYSAQKYNGSPKKMSYKIAYAHDVALQKQADAGDYVDICFSQEDGTFMYAEYFNQREFKIALLYNYGTYWDFREEGNSIYSGYYYHKPGKSEGGIVIEYGNGRSTETGYFSVESGDVALFNVLN